MKKALFGTFLTFSSLYALETEPLPLLGSEPSRLGEIQSFIADRLCDSNSYTVTVDRAATDVTFDIENQRVKIPADVDMRVDQDGFTPLTKFALATAYGKAMHKDDPRKYITFKPRISTTSRRVVSTMLLGLGTMVTALGFVELAMSAGIEDDLSRKALQGAGAFSSVTGPYLAVAYGVNGVLDSYGISVNITRKQQLQHEGEFFACEVLSREDLTDFKKALEHARCSLPRHFFTLNLVESRLEKIKCDARNVE